MQSLVALELAVAAPRPEQEPVWGWMPEWMQGRGQEQGAVRTLHQTGVTGSQWGKKEETLVVTIYKIPYFRKTTTHIWLHFYWIQILYSLLCKSQINSYRFKLKLM